MTTVCISIEHWPGHVRDMFALHCGSSPGRFKTSNYSLSHELGSVRVSERAIISAAERSAQAKQAMLSERMSERCEGTSPVLTSRYSAVLNHCVHSTESRPLTHQLSLFLCFFVSMNGRLMRCHFHSFHCLESVFLSSSTIFVT